MINILKKFVLLLTVFTTLSNSAYANFSKRSKKLFLETPKTDYKEHYYLNKKDEEIFRQIKKKIRNKEWFEAYKLEKKIENAGYRSAINLYISLQKFKNIDVMTPQEVKGLIDFNTEFYFLKNFSNFNDTIEFYYLENLVKYDEVGAYFKKFKSKNIDVIIKLLQDEKKLIETVYANNESRLKKEIVIMDSRIRNRWINEEFNEKEQLLFLNTFKTVITDWDKIKRAELLAFKKNFTTMKQLVTMIENEEYKILFNTVLEIEEKNPESLTNILRNIPKNLRNNELLLFTQLKYYRAKNKDEKAIDILLNLKGKKEYSKYWWIYKTIYARDLMKEGKYKKSYTLVSEYDIYDDDNYSESQWLSGWIALRYLKNPDMATKHFHNYYKSVSYPTNVAKSSYWLGRAYQDKGNEKEALYWFDISSGYTLTFYGQLSHYAKYNILTARGVDYKDIELPAIPEITEADIKSIDENKIVKFAFLYYNYEGKREEANNIFKELVSTLLGKKGEIAELLKSIQVLDDESMIIPLSRIASYRMVFFTDNLFPLLKMVRRTDENIAIIHSIIKQESGFIVHAESVAGAIGFMQIMPTTAKELCRQLRITYNQYKLKNDPQYNIKLGSYYINQLIKQFQGSKILAIASYNAGPNATNRWIRDFGDPRKQDNIDDVIDWMESITYKETRNYVQRILENLLVYEYKLGINNNK